MICFIVRRENIDFVITLKEDPSADCHYSEGQAERKKKSNLIIRTKKFSYFLAWIYNFLFSIKTFFSLKVTIACQKRFSSFP
jgi:hypothetical protein